MDDLKNIQDHFRLQKDKLIEQYSKLKGKYNKITYKQLQERIELKIKLTKLSNRIDVMDRLIETFKIIIEDEKKGIISLKDIPSSKELLNRINCIIEKEILKLDTISKQKVLVNEFRDERKKGQVKNGFISLKLVGGCVAILISIVGSPLIYSTFISFSTLNSLLATTISFIMGYSLTSVIVNKKINDRIKIFNNLNQELGENAIPREINNPILEEYQLMGLISDKIDEINILVNKIINELIFENSQLSLQNENLVNNNVNDEINFNDIQYNEENIENVRRHIEKRNIDGKDGKVWGIIENPGVPCDVEITEESRKILAKRLLK